MLSEISFTHLVGLMASPAGIICSYNGNSRIFGSQSVVGSINVTFIMNIISPWVHNVLFLIVFFLCFFFDYR